MTPRPGRVQARTSCQSAAETALKEKMAARSDFHATGTLLTPDSPFSALVTYWLEDLELDDHLSKTTKQLYERNMRTLVVPAFRGFTPRGIGVVRCDRLIKELAGKSHNRAKQARNVLRLAFGLAVRHEVLPRNPMENTAKLRRQLRHTLELATELLGCRDPPITIKHYIRRNQMVDSVTVEFLE